MELSECPYDHNDYAQDNNNPPNNTEPWTLKNPRGVKSFMVPPLQPLTGLVTISSRETPLNQGGMAPKITDPSTAGFSVEFPPPWPEWIEEVAESIRIIRR